MPDLARRIAVARGDEPADLVVKGGRVLSVFTREWLETDIAVCDGYVAGLGDYEGQETLDVGGAYVVPGFIDAHMHLESTKLLVDEFARLVLPMGTTAVVADPHEIANVLGSDGIHWLLDVCSGLPLDVYFTASSCVPASRFESPRRPLTAGDLQGLLRRRRVIGLAEMMNFPGVIAGDPAELEKLGARRRPPRGRPCPRRAREGAQRLCRSGHPLRPRGAHGRGGPTAAARRHVAADPRGLDGAEPRGSPAARAGIRHRAHGVLHGRPRPRGHRRLRAPQPDGAEGRRGGRRARGRARPRLAEPGAVARPRPPRRDRARLPGRSRRARRPRVLRAPHGAQGRPPRRRHPGGARAGVGEAHGARAADLGRRLLDSVERRAARG